MYPSSVIIIHWISNIRCQTCVWNKECPLKYGNFRVAMWRELTNFRGINIRSPFNYSSSLPWFLWVVISTLFSHDVTVCHPLFVESCCPLQTKMFENFSPIGLCTSPFCYTLENQQLAPEHTGVGRWWVSFWGLTPSGGCQVSFSDCIDTGMETQNLHF